VTLLIAYVLAVSYDCMLNRNAVQMSYIMHEQLSMALCVFWIRCLECFCWETGHL